MNKKRIFVSIYLMLALILLVGMCGCGKKKDEVEAPAEIENKIEEAGEKAEGYNISELINNTDIDVSELEDVTITREEAKEILDVGETVRKEILQFEESYKKNNEISYDNMSDYLYELYKHLESMEIEGVHSYSLHDTYLGVWFIYDTGEYIYTPYIEGMDAGASAEKLQIATYQPFLSSYPSSVDKYMPYADDSAKLIETEFPMYQFDDRGTSDDQNYDDEEVTLLSVLNFSQNNIIFWHGHGGYFEDYGVVLATAVPVTEENLQKYNDELQEGILCRGVSGGKETFLVTPEFFRTYLPEGTLTNTIIYLGTCKSGYDTSMIDVLLEKGAMAVYANSGEISSVYNLSMMKSIATALTMKNGENYYTLQEALEYAQKENGAEDWTGTKVFLTYGNGYSNVSLDWYEDYKTAERDVVLVLDRSGSMEGNPILQTKEAAVNFLDTVYEQDSRVALVSYDNEAEINQRLTRNSDWLKESINDIWASGGTNIYDGIAYADDLLSKSNSAKKIIVLMSDGMPNNGPSLNDWDYATPLIDYASELKNKGYYIYTLGFFSELYSEELTYAQELMENIASPGLHFEVDSAENLVYFFDDIANQISGTKYVYIRIACPVDVTVKSGGETLSSKEGAENTRTSFGTLTYENVQNTNPNTNVEMYPYQESYVDSTVDRVKILRLNMEKDYDIDIKGYDTGTMDYTISYPDQNGEYTDVRKFPNIAVTTTTKAAWEV